VVVTATGTLFAAQETLVCPASSPNVHWRQLHLSIPGGG
jgi:hypothetical protein